MFRNLEYLFIYSLILICISVYVFIVDMYCKYEYRQQYTAACHKNSKTFMLYCA